MVGSGCFFCVWVWVERTWICRVKNEVMAKSAMHTFPRETPLPANAHPSCSSRVSSHDTDFEESYCYIRVKSKALMFCYFFTTFIILFNNFHNLAVYFSVERSIWNLLSFFLHFYKVAMLLIGTFCFYNFFLISLLKDSSLWEVKQIGIESFFGNYLSVDDETNICRGYWICFCIIYFLYK